MALCAEEVWLVCKRLGAMHQDQKSSATCPRVIPHTAGNGAKTRLGTWQLVHAKSGKHTTPVQNCSACTGTDTAAANDKSTATTKLQTQLPNALPYRRAIKSGAAPAVWFSVSELRK